MKRLFYIVSFTFLGILLQFLAHSLIEIWYIGLLLADFPKYGLGLTWDTWILIHNVLTVIFIAAGVWIGRKEGIYWWRKIYEENAIALWKERWKNKKIPTSWLVVLFLILLVGSIYWYYVDDVKPYLNKNNGPVIEDQDFLRRQVIWQQERRQKELEAETAGWQTYRNEKYGFEVKYPEDWQISQAGPGDPDPHPYLLNGVIFDSSNRFREIFIKVYDEKWISMHDLSPDQKAILASGSSLRRISNELYTKKGNIIIQLNTEYEKPNPAFADDVFSTFKFLK